MKYKKKNHSLKQVSESEYFNTEIFEPITANLSIPSSHEPVRTVIKQSKAFARLSQEFPFTLQEFLPILQLIGESNTSINKLHSFLSSENLLSSIGSNSFPIKVDIPLTMTVKGLVTFEKFELLNDPSFLELPEYKFQSRKLAQKILTCPKKRLFLANLVI